MKRVIVITGGSGGLGKRLVRFFSDNGDAVCTLSRSNGEDIPNHYVCDVTDCGSVNAAIAEIVQTFGSIDILICGAGIGLAGAIEDTPLQKVKAVFDVNFFGVINTVQACVPYMKRGSKIVAISSASAFFSLPYRSIYSASKSALNIMATGLNMELNQSGIEVCSVCPGEIDTAFTQNRLWHYGGKHDNELKRIAEKFTKHKNRRMSAEKVAYIIYGKLNGKRRLPPLFIIGAKYKFYYFLSKILPLRLFIALTAKKYGGKS